MIEKILKKIEAFLSGEYPHKSETFSIYLEDYLCDNYDEMFSENAEITDLMNEEIPEICAAMEPNSNDEEFKRLLKIEYGKVLKLKNKVA